MKTSIREIPWKQWLYDTALKLDLMPDQLRMRINRGQYPKPKIRKEGRNLTFVIIK